MAPALLVLDGAVDPLRLALRHAAGQAFSAEVPGGPAASTGLIPAVQALLDGARMRGHDLQAIGVGGGPGAFTGLRSALAVAQGLALGWQCPIVMVDSLQVLAEDAAAQQPTVHAWRTVQDARMGEFYVACYARDPAPTPDALVSWRRTRAPTLYTRAELLQAAATDAPTLGWVGQGLDSLDGLQAALQACGRAYLSAQAPSLALLRLAEQAWQRGEACPPEHANLHYVRDKVALTTAERLQVRPAPARPSTATAPPPPHVQRP